MDHRCIHSVPSLSRSIKTKLQDICCCSRVYRPATFMEKETRLTWRTSDWSTSLILDFRDLAMLQLRIYSSPNGIWEQPNLSAVPWHLFSLFKMCTFLLLMNPFWYPSGMAQRSRWSQLSGVNVTATQAQLLLLTSVLLPTNPTSPFPHAACSPLRSNQAQTLGSPSLSAFPIFQLELNICLNSDPSLKDLSALFILLFRGREVSQSC